MSDIQTAIGALSATQTAVMAAEDFETYTAQTSRQTLDALERRGMLEMKKRERANGYEAILTDLGTDVRNALLGGTSVDLPDVDRVIEVFEDLVNEWMVPIEQVYAVGLGELDIMEDEVLLNAYVGATADGDTPLLEPQFNEELVFNCALRAARGALVHVIDEDFHSVSYLDAFSIENIQRLYTAQFKAPNAFPTETLFRFVVPNAADHWPDCPDWLRVWLDVFAAVTISLKPHVAAAREALVARVREVKDQGRNRRNKAKSDEKRAAKLKKKKDRLRKMKQRREAAEKANAAA